MGRRNGEGQHWVRGLRGTSYEYKISHEDTLYSTVRMCPVTSVTSNSGTPWTAARQAPLSMGSSRQEYWGGLPCPPPGGLTQGRNMHFLGLLHWQVGSLPLAQLGNSYNMENIAHIL